MESGERQYNPKQSREQKIRRDRRRKDIHKPGSSSSTQGDASKEKKDVDPKNRESEDKQSQEVTKTLAGEKCADSTEAKDVPVFDFASLKRETDEITAMTSKKFSKRQVYSNWSRYEEMSEAYEAWKEEKNPSADFESLLNAPVSAGGHFKFKSERSWDVNPASLYSEYFALDLDTMSQGLACIPFYQKLDLPKSLFSVKNLESSTLIKMSDNETSAADDTKRKRGRPAKAGVEIKEVIGKDAKKRGRSAADEKKEVKKSDGASPAKRGRGRPKGSTKKKSKASPKKASVAGRGRGRPKREEKKEDIAVEDEEEDEDEEEEEGDE